MFTVITYSDLAIRTVQILLYCHWILSLHRKGFDLSKLHHMLVNTIQSIHAQSLIVINSTCCHKIRIALDLIFEFHTVIYPLDRQCYNLELLFIHYWHHILWFRCTTISQVFDKLSQFSLRVLVALIVRVITVVGLASTPVGTITSAIGCVDLVP